MKVIGIYKIINRINNKYYVGSSNNILYRIEYRHKRALRENRHWNLHLQRAWNKYGEKMFDFIIIERFQSPKSYVELWQEEQKWLNIAKTEQDNCYNQSFIAGGIDFTPEVRHKMSIATKCRLKRDGHPLLGKHPSKKTLKKLSESHKGLKMSESAKRKISGINSVAHRPDVKKAKQNWWKILRNDSQKYVAFCKSRGEKSRKAKLLYGKNYEIIGD
jgi:group I intron endonuclease